MLKMQYSGYDKKCRYEVAKSTIKPHQTIKDNEESRVRPTQGLVKRRENQGAEGAEEEGLVQGGGRDRYTLSVKNKLAESD